MQTTNARLHTVVVSYLGAKPRELFGEATRHGVLSASQTFRDLESMVCNFEATRQRSKSLQNRTLAARSVPARLHLRSPVDTRVHTSLCGSHLTP
jgi:hypothetical protein